mmetsp:Transcript_34008/g.86086  ORF Transcript_34008/g.86086 Transcript_34008/m.86086 type:complete len:215 (-) Transcript_34008:788-1432(-)|eukprot:CAMPEP_0202874684 /NCGR_PEP_ID=MMETSP1391-20130828/25838_1 /ASSEMBLY_ACC=CAM_ASM_000867 /TAXON_ID=1034604 /ORGANISM="Chlamydomonas leiostraca, Strain SAG 11-49" /LENGTH=214 /DNA_ID=CAMNT_0049556181 /DNA_START=178 /DNA_END=822 /DNA_ORIENTATION=+
MPRPTPPALVPQGRTELGLVCAKGDLERWDELLELHVDVHAIDDFQETALHLACTYNQMEMVKVLVKEAKLEIEATNYEGWTPLCCAIAWGHLDIAKYLLKCGARAGHTTPDGNTLLHLAAWYDCAESVDWLLSHGMKACVENRFGVRPFDMARPGAVRRLLHTAMLQEQGGAGEESEEQPAAAGTGATAAPVAASRGMSQSGQLASKRGMAKA